MRLRQLLAGVAPLGASLDSKMEISGICYDSRTLQPGELFVALPGSRTDGHRFIWEAVERGASCVVCEHPPEGEGPWITVLDARVALAALSANWFGHPARELTVIGVTGTNGKTTTTYLLKEVLEEVLGARVGLIGTNRNMIGGESLPAQRTTPESWEVQKLLRMQPCGDGGLFPRAGPPAGGGDLLCSGDLHQSHPGSPGLPWDHGGISGGQGPALPAV